MGDIVLAPASIDPNIAANTPAQFLQALVERRNSVLAFRVVRSPVHEQADAPQTISLLRARRERPSSGSAAERPVTPAVRCHVAANLGVMNESLGLASHNSSCNCTGCGMLRAGVCINCAENAAALILESGPGDIAVEPCSGACREALQLYFSTPPERWRGQRPF